ncbi:MAG: type II 3-dehydroquinate dehydratase [Coriobacteriia bacterium]|nr:type II 3-dehydroquinate dehydratase [Coriobacteriia bacterium]
MRILVLSGPNLNMLGSREPHVYGTETLKDVEEMLVALGGELGVELEFYQSNHEGELIDALHRAHASSQAAVFNPGAFTHYSYALRDGISAIDPPVVECHLSNLFAREGFRHKSVITPVCAGQVSGFGIQSYALALRAAVALAGKAVGEGA